MPVEIATAVSTPFRMQPGLRRLPDAARVLHALAPGSAVFQAKAAVLQGDAGRALVAQPGVDVRPAWQWLAAEAASQCPGAIEWDGQVLRVHRLGLALDERDRVRAVPRAVDDVFPDLGTMAPAARAGVESVAVDSLAGWLESLDPPMRLPGLLSLALHEDFAVIDGRSAHLPAMAVCLPSHWDPAQKVGRHFAEVHAPVADNALLLAAGERLMALVCGPQRWERFVWTVSPDGALDQHPGRAARRAWPAAGGSETVWCAAWWRTERQSFLPLPGGDSAVFTIQVECRPLAEAVRTTGEAQRLHDAIASMSEAVLRYRGLLAVRDPLLQALVARGARPAAASGLDSGGQGEA